MRSLVTSKVGRICGYEYLIVRAPDRKPEEIDRATARQYIEDHGLVLAYQDKYGKVWDTPDQEFREKYKGWGSNPQKAAIIDKKFGEI